MSVGLLDFFVLEASDYIDRLQRLVATGETQGPDSGALLKLARGLRSSAVMARLVTFADAASGLERTARVLQEGRIAWTEPLAAAVTDSIAELRALVPMARLWGDQHDERARSAAGKLNEVLDVAERHGEMMQRDGVISDAPAPPPTPVTPAAAPVPANAAVSAFLHSFDQQSAGSTPPAPPNPPVSQPAAAPRVPEPVAPPAPAAGLAAMSDGPMPIVPIATLAPASEPDSVVYRAPNPAITFAQRFFSDVTPLVGSLRARLAPLRQGAMQSASSDMVAAFRPVLVSLRDVAASYQHDDIRAFCDAVLTAKAPLPAAAAGALDTALTVMLQQDLPPHVRSQRLAELRRVVTAATPLTSPAAPEAPSRSLGAFTPRRTTPVMSTPLAPPAPPRPTVSRPTPAAPSGQALSSLLSSSLEKVRELDATPLGLITIPEPTAPPALAAPDGEPDVVPIDSLLYRGPRALSRARHIVGRLRTSGGTYDPSLMQELFDLVELAGSAS